jgi:isoleucyl-tRNA synthetase
MRWITTDYIVKHMLQFLDELTNWYVRLNRSRMKGEEGV